MTSWAAKVLALVVALAPCRARAEDPAGIEFFEKKVRPVLVRHCYECHSTASIALKGGLQLDTREGIRRGGDSGAAVVPGSAEESLLLSAVRYETFEMPPAGKLPDEVIADLTTWIGLGAPDPRDAPPAAAEVADQVWRAQLAQRRGWWAYQPVAKPPVPMVRDQNGSDQPIDRFILARLEAAGLAPAPPANARSLVRRLSFALTGLPPAPADVENFAADPSNAAGSSDAAWAALVERWMASPHFGERWARHWMDVVRYTDTYGYEWDIPAKGAWRYRDFLIRAFNQDVPFDQLVREHLAGDLLAEKRIDAQEQIDESRIGPMFFQMGEKRHGDSTEFNGIHQEMLDNKIDAFSKAFQATTISCARCHDHKIDVVSQRDYYALAGMFMSSRWITNTVDLPERNAAVIAELKALKAQLRPLVAAAWRRDVQGMGDNSVWRRLTEAREKEPPPWEDPLYAWMQVVKAAREGGDVAAAWTAAAVGYREQAAARAADNAVNFVAAADFRQGAPEGWSVDGVGLREVAACGDFTVALEGDAVVGRLLPGGLFTHMLSPRLNGAVRTPHFNRSSSYAHISFECCGGDFAAGRTVVDNAFLTEKQKYLDRKEPAWELMQTLTNMPDRHIYIEFATKTSNPNFPPRVGLGGACREEQVADPRSWFGITRAVFHNAPKTPADELTRFRTLFEPSVQPGAAGPAAPATFADAAKRYEAWFDAAVEAWRAGRASEDDVRLVNWLLANELATNRLGAVSAEIAGLTARYREAEARLALPWTVNGMADVDPAFDYRLNIRGDYDQLGDAIPHGYPEVMCRAIGGFDDRSSGRARLAELVAARDNPLTARVFVNRVWHWLFGTGLVATPDDFGRLGTEPSHPELLDWLASRFVDEGWSLKRLVRSIVLSRTWRQSGQVRGAALEADPANRLLHHYSLRRLEAEEIRDQILAASGRLDPRLGGPPINPHRANEDPQKRLFSGPLDGDGRRSIYTKITIMEPPRLLALFNQPAPKIPTGRRDVTNTPAQSLALLNDDFVTAQAQHWAARLVARIGETPAQRLDFMFRTALGRGATSAETVRWLAALNDLAALRRVSEQDRMSSTALWKDMAHAVFNLKEFIYIQ
ncbi:MAG TPA: PSD1 and planctomycete cytochrome C domain-containing protein [Pirellulales bacterium]|nr:PSD1 and planctomycete cytochrome C domain-containing protein [Pirellulales bacterium]